MGRVIYCNWLNPLVLTLYWLFCLPRPLASHCIHTCMSSSACMYNIIVYCLCDSRLPSVSTPGLSCTNSCFLQTAILTVPIQKVKFVCHDRSDVTVFAVIAHIDLPGNAVCYKLFCFQAEQKVVGL